MENKHLFSANVDISSLCISRVLKVKSYIIKKTEKKGGKWEK